MPPIDNVCAYAEAELRRRAFLGAAADIEEQWNEPDTFGQQSDDLLGYPGPQDRVDHADHAAPTRKCLARAPSASCPSPMSTNPTSVDRYDRAVTSLQHFLPSRMTTLPRRTQVSAYFRLLNPHAVSDHLSTPNTQRAPTNCLTNTSRLSINFIKVPDCLFDTVTAAYSVLPRW